MKGRERILKLLEGGAVDRPVRGEIWPLASGGTSAEIIAAARESKADFCFFDQMPGAVDDARACGMASGAVVNGPWQRFLNRVGWEEAMLGLGRGNEGLLKGLTEAAAEAGREIALWSAAGVDLILLADDIAYSGGPYMSPAQLETHLLPLYSELVFTAAETGPAIGFHSDGCMDLLLPSLHTAGFQFYSLETEGTSPKRAWELLGAAIPLLSGVPAVWLMPGGFLPAKEGHTLREWLKAGPLSVTSACGLYHAEAALALQVIYQWLDQEK